MNDLIKELREWFTEYGSEVCMGYGKAGKEFLRILSRHEHDKAVEPLAITGYKKDLFVTFVWNGLSWFCHITDGKGDMVKITSGGSYDECEAKAREYLESLEDKK